jgi:hypothetical protein
VPITKEQLKTYCSPFLKRQNFSFGNLRDAIGDDRMRDLRVGEAFSSPKAGSQSLQLELQDANPYLKDPITKALAKLNQRHTPKEKDRISRKARDIFAEHGIFSDFGRPASFGLILEKTEILGLDTYFVLGKYDGGNLHTGRPDSDGKDAYLTINVTNAAGRLIGMLDIMLEVSDPLIKDHEYRLVKNRMDKYSIGLTDAREMLDRMLMTRNAMRMSGGELTKCFAEIGSAFANPALFALNVIATRAGIARLERMMSECDEPATFLFKAINPYVAATLAHEVAYITERRANGELRTRRKHMELLAYLIEAVHSRPDIAFSGLVSETDADVYRKAININEELPELARELKRHNGLAFLQAEEYLQNWAERCLDSCFMRLARKPLEEVIDVGPIRAFRGSEYIGTAHLPLLNASICNPTLR